MTIRDEDRELARRAKAAFDRSTEDLSGEVRSRLTQARYAALEELEANRGFSFGRQWMPAGGLALAAVLAAVLWLSRPAPSEGPISAIEDLELVLAEESLEMFEELEFYSWLGDQPELKPDGVDTDIG